MRCKLFTLALLLAAALPASARDLAVPSDKGWQHAATGLILTASLDGLPRTRLIDLTETEHDVAAEFATADHSVVATVYIFRPALDDVAVWFDRSATMIEKRDVYGGATPLHPAPLSFAPPGAGTAASALRQAYTPGKPPYRGTALAVMPLDEWLVKIRFSAVDLNAAEVDARMSRIIAALRWPGNFAPVTAAIPIAACAKPLAYKKAKIVKADMSDVLVASVLPGIAASKAAETSKQAAPTKWCRDGEASLSFGTYREVDGGMRYSLAINDAGRAIHVAPSFMFVLAAGPERYNVTYAELDGTTSTYPSFDRLPKPEQAFDLVQESAPLSRSTSDGKSITFDNDAFKN